MDHCMPVALSNMVACVVADRRSRLLAVAAAAAAASLLLACPPGAFARAAGAADDPRRVWGKPSRAGITTTFRVEEYLDADWESVLRYWANFHCELLGADNAAAGFEKIYMFADSEYTETYLHSVFPEGTSCVETVPAWGWRDRETEDDLHDFITRQTVNCENAYDRAARAGLGWLVHMDVDELFYLNGVGSLRRHLKRLTKLKIGSYTYANLEAVADRPHMSNYFESVPAGAFKKHPSFFGLSPRDLWASPDSVLNQLGFAPPSQGSTADGSKREYFFSYSNGKSIVRVGRLAKAERPENRNHYWVWKQPPGGVRPDKFSVRVHGKVLRNCKGFVYDQIEHAQYDRRVADDIRLLHFVNVGFLFWRDKYLLLGRFHNAYLKRFPVPFDSMLHSRDIVAAAAEAQGGRGGGAVGGGGGGGGGGGDSKAMEYFRTTFLCSEACRAELEEHDVLALDIDVAKEKARLLALREDWAAKLEI